MKPSFFNHKSVSHEQPLGSGESVKVGISNRDKVVAEAAQLVRQNALMNMPTVEVPTVPTAYAAEMAISAQQQPEPMVPKQSVMDNRSADKFPATAMQQPINLSDQEIMAETARRAADAARLEASS